MGQFLTPSPIAEFMASLFGPMPATLRVLDAGAGLGNLTAAVVAEACRRSPVPTEITASTYELDDAMLAPLRLTLGDCAAECQRTGTAFHSRVMNVDFVADAVRDLDGGLFGPRRTTAYTHAILNPPYKKLASDSPARLALRRVGIETSNLYTAFLGLAVLLLEPGGELVAITPRSFCNGPYFRPFRELLLREMSLRRIHVFESRTDAFSDDAVLQETVILHAVKHGPRSRVVISSSDGPDDDWIALRDVPLEDVVRANDPEHFIRIVPDTGGDGVAGIVATLPATLRDLGLTVSTGKVVDFRAREYLRGDPESGSLPLIYPTHFSAGRVTWPKAGKKPNALMDVPATADLWMPSGDYVLVKRFSSKEEPRRVVAAVFDEASVDGKRIGFENHLNVFHQAEHGMTRLVAKGLATFLNSTLVDEYFRQFSGHTQVNATDLRTLRYPDLQTLEAIGEGAASFPHDQDAIDSLVGRMLGMSKKRNPITLKRRLDEGLTILRALGMPRQQQNDRSALTLLALLDLKPTTKWSAASAPLRGITPIMDFIAEHYGKTYAPNTRETVRRQTVHQFLDAGMIVANPDDPKRPVNSPKAVYQIDAQALALLRTFGSKTWPAKLDSYLGQRGALSRRYASERQLTRLPVKFPDGQTLTLSPGGQNTLVIKILEDFCSLFAPGGKVMYVGDAGNKWAFFDEQAASDLGIRVDTHGKMPDVVVYRPDKNWLLLIEAVTSHGPLGPKRRGELAQLFAGVKAGLVYVTAFLERRAMVKHLGDISWETEVWVAEAPSHMIHFDGERFLGPY